MTSVPWPKAIVVVPQTRMGVGQDEIHPMVYVCRTQGAVGWGRGTHTSLGEGWVTRGPGLLLHTATPQWSPPCALVALPRWPAGGRARDPVPWPPRLGKATLQIAC